MTAAGDQETPPRIVRLADEAVNINAGDWVVYQLVEPPRFGKIIHIANATRIVHVDWLSSEAVEAAKDDAPTGETVCVHFVNPDQAGVQEVQE